MKRRTWKRLAAGIMTAVLTISGTGSTLAGYASDSEIIVDTAEGWEDNSTESAGNGSFLPETPENPLGGGGNLILDAEITDDPHLAPENMETAAESEIGTEAGSESETESETGMSESNTDTEIESETAETVIEQNSEELTETGSEYETEPLTEGGTEMLSEETQTEPLSENIFESELLSEETAESEDISEKESAFETESERVSETNIENGSETESEAASESEEITESCTEEMTELLAELDEPAPVDDFTYGDLVYYVSGENAIISGYTGEGGSIVIPSTIEEYPVTAIDSYAFGENRTITSVSIPESVLSIGDHAFYNCESLISVTISKGLTTIGDCAFAGCGALKELPLPESVTSLGVLVIKGTSVSSITIPKNVASCGHNPPGYSDGGQYAGPLSGALNLSEVIFEEGMETIPAYVCSTNSYSSYVEKVVIPSSAKSIGERAFNSCGALESINFPEGLTSIDGCAFYGCGSLPSLELPNPDKPEKFCISSTFQLQ